MLFAPEPTKASDHGAHEMHPADGFVSVFALDTPDRPEARPSTSERGRGGPGIVARGPSGPAGDQLPAERRKSAVARNGLHLFEGKLRHGGDASPDPRDIAKEGLVVEARAVGEGPMGPLDTDGRELGLKLGHALPA